MKFLKILVLLLAISFISCGDDGKEVDRIGIAGECQKNEDCKTEGLICIKDFKGGYCGKIDCNKNSDCPEGSICVTLNEKNYCFRECLEKEECNENRSAESQANCSSNFNLAHVEDEGKKACLPPSDKL